MWVGEVKDADAGDGGDAGKHRCVSSNGDESTGVGMSSVTTQDAADQGHSEDGVDGDGCNVLHESKCGEGDDEVVKKDFAVQSVVVAMDAVDDMVKLKLTACHG